MVLERKIYFYRMLLRNNGQIVDPREVFTYINSLPFNDAGRYQLLKEENKRSMYIDSSISPFRIRLGNIRLTGLPNVEAGGQISPLAIPRDSGLYEPMHFMVFPNNVVGFESNFYAPRPPSLSYYLLNRASGIVNDIELLPLIRHDVAEILSRIGEIRSFRLRVNRDMVQYMADLNNNLSDAFNVLRQGTDAETIEVVLRCERHSSNGIHIPFLGRLPTWLARPEVRPGVDDLVLKARDDIDGGIQEFDLLEQYLLSKKEVITQDEIHRSVNTTAMYNAINEAYTELRAEINLIVNGMH